MNGRERVLSALNHNESKPIPADFGATPVTGIHVSCVAELREYYGLEKRLIKTSETGQMLGEIDDDLKDILGASTVAVPGFRDFFGLRQENWKEWRTPWGQTVLVPGEFSTTEDDGNVYIYPQGDMSAKASGRMPKSGYFFDAIVRQHPIDDDNLNPDDNLEEFPERTDDEIADWVTRIKSVQGSGRAVCANFGGTALGDIALVPASFMKDPKGIRDLEEWYMSTLIRTDYLHEIFDRQTDIAVKNLAKLNAAAGDLVDVVFICGTDFGTQISTFCSAETYKELYMPYYKKMNNWIHENTNWKTFKHSCGAIESFIPLLAESGFEIINPVQCSATGMDAELIKEKHGANVTFWGGGVDTQKILPFGTPAEVREQTLRRCEIFSKCGGFVFNSIHNIQAKTPVENIVAMVDALKEFNK